MRKKHAYLAIALLLLIFVGCQKLDESIEPGLSNGNTIKVDTIGGALFHSIPYQHHNVIIKQVDDKYFFSDDIQISRRQFNLLRSGGLAEYTKPRSAIIDDFTYRWSSGEWRYLIASTRRTEILQAIQMIADVSNITFIELTSNPGHSNYVTIVDDNSEGTSFSNHIGCEPGNKELHLHSSQGVGTIAHEILHSLGIFHEQTRPDRDNFINVFIDRLPSDPTVRYQYNINPLSRGVGGFDFESIMLYPSVRNGVTIMERKDNTTWGFQRSYLSTGDIQGLAALYGDKFPIQGPTSFCNSATYSISNLPVGASVSWAVSNTTLASLAPSGSAVTITRSAYGSANLLATVLFNGNSIVVTKPIILVYKQPTITVNGGNTWGGSKFYIIGNTEPGTSYRLEVTTPSGSVYTALGEVSLDQLGKYWVRLYLTNSCFTEKLVHTSSFISVDDGGPIH
ncbi:M12 family metallopeptidase [Niabella yanshanensis]|uniref:M12 family metallopeptidase n=1 Tax=Niabella yanshanensis TaxID=577386 RepID=A0ABZ0W5N4_9BACT|nr:M12 family metallopeptidase [Niabella yanshanensis]WQD37933.1 M12 family metallopeptidase [Niabella yanshanensis]